NDTGLRMHPIRKSRVLDHYRSTRCEIHRTPSTKPSASRNDITVFRYAKFALRILYKAAISSYIARWDERVNDLPARNLQLLTCHIRNSTDCKLKIRCYT